ncbi:hypothetical protein [Polaribacter gangjinensis]|uniref:Transposase n=1 Tax=Polaribacter gangjinensis TaxID=574710 RepID=A0A2S7WDG2_9FLAO|nr:hypothetical protein [Polaribacter gangjinensis]PQJ75664.1 hypothetical protein BTO13_10695 [Polaribacter gangjinensis]
MKLIRIKRKTRQQKYYSSAMGMLNSRVTFVKKYLFGIPIKTIHKYRETYYGEIKNCDDCNLFI